MNGMSGNSRRANRRFHCSWLPPLTMVLLVPLAAPAAGPADVRPFLKAQCLDCHSGESAEGGLDLTAMSWELSRPEMFARWERIHDRVAAGEMPPKSETPPPPAERASFVASLAKELTAAHAASKGTVLRRLNRREYQNTLNDLFGTHVKLEGLLPEDGRSHEFDNIGSALGLSMVHLQRYMEAAGSVFDEAVADSTDAPKPEKFEASYLGTREAESFIGKNWKQLSDGAVVRFSSGGYPTGMMRSANFKEAGRYRIKVSGYAWQAKEPLTFWVEGTSFAPGAEKPIFGFWSFPPGKPGDSHTIEFEAWLDRNYMLAIEPYGINDPQRYKRMTIDGYDGPGLAILKVSIEGPLVDQFPTRGHHLVFDGIERREIPPRNPRERERRGYRPQFEVKSANELADARQSLLRVARAAFRRPVSDPDIDRFVALFKQERADGAAFEDALRTTVSAIFCSPRFLYLQEPPGKLNGDALGTRLAYFLTRTTPDAELQKVASQLSGNDALLREQTNRLLADPRFERFVVDFTDNWLDLREMDATMPDESLYPEFDPYLRHSMPLETRAFLRELVASDLPVTNLVSSEFAMLNSRLAAHYGLPPVQGAAIQKVKLPAASPRGGFLTQASILKVTANGTNSSPVTRGAWVMERILDQPPPPPPPGISGVEPDIRGATTLRDLLAKHRTLTTCNACHQKIDPPGFALESFNPIGGYQDRYRSLGAGDPVKLEIDGRKVRYRLGPKVDSSGELEGNRSFTDINGFRKHLANDPEQLARAFTKNLLAFATGREMGFSDRPEIERIVKESAAAGYGVRGLLHLVVQSDLFRSK